MTSKSFISVYAATSNPTAFSLFVPSQDRIEAYQRSQQIKADLYPKRPQEKTPPGNSPNLTVSPTTKMKKNFFRRIFRQIMHRKDDRTEEITPLLVFHRSQPPR